MNAQRAQDLLKHITDDEDYGMKVLKELTLAEAIEVSENLLNACIKKADESKRENDAAFFADIQQAYRPVIIDKIRTAEHLWVVYSDVTGYPYEVDGDMLVLYDYAQFKKITDRLNAQGYLAVLSLVSPEQFAVEISHMYRNGYKRIRFISATSAQFIVEREELYPYDHFVREDYVTNPALSHSMIAMSQETRKESRVQPGAPEEAYRQMLRNRETEFVTAFKNAEFMVPCVKEENGEEVELSIQCIDVSERVESKDGEQVIAIPVFTDGFEMDKCYPGHYENMLCTYKELMDTVNELGASGIIINALGISQYMSAETLNNI